jgi:hypothetical protein
MVYIELPPYAVVRIVIGAKATEKHSYTIKLTEILVFMLVDSKKTRQELKVLHAASGGWIAPA